MVPNTEIRLASNSATYDRRLAPRNPGRPAMLSEVRLSARCCEVRSTRICAGISNARAGTAVSTCTSDNGRHARRVIAKPRAHQPAKSALTSGSPGRKRGSPAGAAKPG
jgi:hypothetical protein